MREQPVDFTINPLYTYHRTKYSIGSDPAALQAWRDHDALTKLKKNPSALTPSGSLYPFLFMYPS